MKEFRIRENGFKEIKKRLIVTLSIMFSTIFLVVIVLPALASDAPGRFSTLPYLTVLFGGNVCSAYGLGLKDNGLCLRVLY